MPATNDNDATNINMVRNVTAFAKSGHLDVLSSAISERSYRRFYKPIPEVTNAPDNSQSANQLVHGSISVQVFDYQILAIAPKNRDTHLSTGRSGVGIELGGVPNNVGIAGGVSVAGGS